MPKSKTSFPMLFMGPSQKDFDNIPRYKPVIGNDSRGCRPYKIIMRPCLRDLFFPMVRYLPYSISSLRWFDLFEWKNYLRTLVGSHNFLRLATDSEAMPSQTLKFIFLHSMF